MKFLSTAATFLLAPAAAVFAASITEIDGDAIENEWIAVLKSPSTSSEGGEMSISSLDARTKLHGILTQHGASATHNFDIHGLFKGVKLSGASRSVLEEHIAQLPEIAYIEPNYAVHTSALKTQPNAPWGLARISQRELDSSTSYVYDEKAGAGTWAYIIDTGIDVTHPQFGGRATWGTSFIQGQTKDGNGHGTHVAGTVGSNTYGVAKKTNLIAVKVLNNAGSGSNANVIQGMEWAVADAKQNGRITKSVANLSLGGGNSQAVKDAVKAMTDAGLFVAVAAGNDAVRVNTTSPANAPSACTVGASDEYDFRAYFSNYGDMIDVFAPGMDILSTYKNHGTEYLSGTSMATPHITGLAAYLISTQGYRKPVAMCQLVQKLATKNVVELSYSKNNMIAFNGVTA